MAGCEYIIGNKRYTEQELKDFLLKGGLKSFLEDKSIDLSKIKGSNKPPTQPPSEENVLMQEPNRNKREFGVKKHLMEAKGIPEHFKQGIEKSGLDYEVSNPQQAQDAARGIVDTMGRDNALRLASEGSIDPSVGSAIFTESLNDIWSEERESRNNGDTQKADGLAREFIAAQDELARISNSGGKWNAQLAHSYKTSPMAFVIRTNAERAEQFKQWFDKNIDETNLKQVHEEFLKSEEGKLLISEKVEELRKEERKGERQKRDKNIDDFFEKAKMKGGTYATIIPPPIWNAAMDVLKVSVKAGDRVVDAVQKAIDHIDKELNGKSWDKDKFQKEYEELLGKIADSGKKEKSATESLDSRKKELQRRIDEKDFSAEEYKEKKTLSEKEKEAQKEYDQVKEAYDEARKESPEYQEKKAKQYLERFRDRLGNLDDEQKDAVIRMSIKDLIKNKALSYDDFKQNIAKVIGIKELSESEITHIEELTADINAVEVAENKMIDSPTDANIKGYEEAKRKGQLSNSEIYNITHKEADITGVTKSWMTGSFLSLFSVIKNPIQNVIFQSTLRFPKALVKKGLDYGLAATGLDKHTTDLALGNKWYWKEARKGLLKSIHNFKTGTQEQDITSKYTYRSTLAPREAAKDIKLWKEGNKFLTKQEVAERYIRKSIFARQADVVLRLMAVGDIPQRHAAEGATAVQIGFKELGIIEDNVMESFILSPKKMAYKLLRAEGKTEVQAESLSTEIEQRIIREGEKAVFQESNWTSEINDWLEKSLKINKENGISKKIAKTTGSIAKTLTFPFIKIPANIAWQTFKAINPEVSLAQASIQLGLANNAYKKGDMATFRRLMTESKESVAHAIVGGGLSMAASYLITNGYVRPSNNSNTKRKESEGERFFGKQNQVNFGRMMGGSDYWVDFSWFGIFGATIDTYAQLQQDKIDRARKGEPEQSAFGNMLDKFEYSAKAGLNQLVFDQGAKTIDALQSGGSKLQTLGVNTFNNLANMTTGATLTAFSKATLKEQARLKGEDIVEEIGNNQKQRNILLRTAMNLYKTDSGEPPARISIWGDPITNDRSFSGIAGTLLGGEKGNADKFALQIYVDATKTGNIDFYPSVTQDKLKVNDEEVKLTPKEQDNLSIYIGKNRKMLVDALISGNSSYGSYQDIPLEKRPDALKNAYKVAREIGTTQFKEDFPQFKDAKVSMEDKFREAREKSKSAREQFEFKRILKSQ